MKFTLDTWKEKASTKLQQTKNLLKKSDIPYITYSTVAALSLWPLIEAVATASSSQSLLATVYVTLGGIGGGIGTNLIAEQLQRWRDQADDIGEEDVINWVRENIISTQDLLATLDNVIEKVGSMGIQGVHPDVGMT